MENMQVYRHQQKEEWKNSIKITGFDAGPISLSKFFSL